MADSQFNPISGGVRNCVKHPTTIGAQLPPWDPKIAFFLGTQKLRFFSGMVNPPQDQGWKGAKTHLNKKNKKIEDMGI